MVLFFLAECASVLFRKNQKRYSDVSYIRYLRYSVIRRYRIFCYIILGIWALVDALLIPGMTRDYNQSLIGRIEGGLGG